MSETGWWFGKSFGRASPAERAEAKRQALMQKLERKAGYTKKQKNTPNSKS